MIHDLQAIGKEFQIEGIFENAGPCGSGFINDTYAVTYRRHGAPVRYVFQRINHEIFKDPPAVMENIVRVTDHIREKLTRAGTEDVERRVLTVVPALSGRSFFCDSEGNTWRSYHFIEQAASFNVIQSLRHASEAARAFGQFQKLLADMPPPRLHETIPDFHHTPRRFAALQKAITDDACARASECGPEIEFILEHENTVRKLVDMHEAGAIPERLIHNDTKVNNVMFDKASGEAICVVDLDTVMPGLVLYDFGDMIRSATATAIEDERDLSKMRMDIQKFEAIARGYLASAREFLNDAEKENLAYSGLLITLEQAIRFLTDYLSGDSYYKTQWEGQNLVRTRTQLKLCESILEQKSEMERVVRETLAACL